MSTAEICAVASRCQIIRAPAIKLALSLANLMITALKPQFYPALPPRNTFGPYGRRFPAGQIQFWRTLESVSKIGTGRRRVTLTGRPGGLFRASPSRAARSETAQHREPQKAPPQASSQFSVRYLNVPALRQSGQRPSLALRRSITVGVALPHIGKRRRYLRAYY